MTDPAPAARSPRGPLTLLVLLGAASAARAEPQGESLAAWAAEARAAADAPALGCVVQRRGGQPEVAVVGVRVAGVDDPATAADAWHWGSITKSMTATLVARLAEQGAIRWDDSIGERLFELVPEMQLDLGDATFRHLLSHHSGLAANIPIARFAGFGQFPEDPIADRLRWVRIALEQEPAGTTGETYLYSNNGYIVAGAMIEAATGTAWEEWMRNEVFAPLGMSGAGFGAPPGAQPRGHAPDGEGGDRPVGPAADNPAALGPAGRVHMPLGDMARYLSAHARRDPGFLEPSSWDRLHTAPFGGNYAMGWVAQGDQRRWHNGSNTMWYAEAAFDRGTGTVAAVAVNDGDLAVVQPAVGALLTKLMARAAAPEASAADAPGDR